MNTIERTTALLACLSLFAIPLLQGDTEASAGADLASAYVWRGLTFNDGTVFQPWMDIAKGGFNCDVWVNYDIGDYDGTLNKAEYSEIDLTLSYSFNLKMVGLTAGIIEYTFPGGGPGTTEVFVDSSIEPIEGLIEF